MFWKWLKSILGQGISPNPNPDPDPSDLSLCQSNLKQVQSDLDYANSQNTWLTERYAAAEEQRQTAEKSLAEAQTKASNFESAYNEQVDKNNSLENTIVNLKENINDLTEANNQLEAANANLRSLLATKPKLKLVDLPEIIKELKPSPWTSNPTLWMEFEKALFIVFARPLISGFQTVKATDIETALKQQWPNIVFHGQAKDGNYRILPSLDSLREILDTSFINLKPWVEDFYDCDKFTEELRIHLTTKYTINSTIEVWGKWGDIYHERALVPIKDGSNLVFVEVEPQNDSAAIVPPGIMDNFAPDTIHDW